MNDLLKQYIKMIVEAKLARVPNQLIGSEDVADEQEEEQSTDDAVEDVQEFSAAGGVVGYALPLGADPDSYGRKKNSSDRKK